MDAKVGNFINSPSQIEILHLEDCDQFTVRDAEGIEAMAVWWAIYFDIEGDWLVVINAICWASEMHVTSRAHSWRRKMACNSHESMQILIYQKGGKHGSAHSLWHPPSPVFRSSYIYGFRIYQPSLQILFLIF